MYEQTKKTPSGQPGEVDLVDERARLTVSDECCHVDGKVYNTPLHLHVAARENDSLLQTIFPIRHYLLQRRVTVIVLTDTDDNGKNCIIDSNDEVEFAVLLICIAERSYPVRHKLLCNSVVRKLSLRYS